MTVPPERGRLRRPALVGALVAGLILPPAVAAAVPAGRQPVAQPARGVAVTLSTIEPVTVRPDRRLTVAGSVRTGRLLRGVVVRLEVGTTPYQSRSQVAESVATTDPEEAEEAVPTVPVPDAQVRLGRVAAGTVSFQIRVRADSLPVGATGVYPMRVRVTSAVDGVEQTQAAVDTFLPWKVAEEGLEPTRLLWLWPLIDRPHRDSQGRFVDDDLADQLTPTGRLSRLVRSAAGRRVAWLVDPALVADVDAMARPHAVVGANQPIRPANDDARRFLADLGAATTDAELFAVRYGDPDLVAVTRARRTGLLANGLRSGQEVITRVLERDARFDLAWPADGFADDPALLALAASGSTSVLLSADSAPLVETPPWTPSGRVDLADGQLAGLLSDPTLDTVVADPGNGAGALLLARQIFLAETLLFTLELPNDPRLAVIAPPRRWEPEGDWPAVLLDATRRADWVRPVTAEQALRREAPTVAREEPTIPEDVDEATLPADVVVGAAAGRASLLSFRPILTDKQPATLIDQALLSTLSTAWRPAPEVAAVQVSSTRDHLDVQRGKVRILTKGATLSAESAPLPITVRNQLDQPVRVRLEVTTSDPIRLRATAPDDVLLIDADSSESVSVELDAVTTGQVDVLASLHTPRGRVYSAPVRIPVDVQAYGRIAVIVFGLAASLLVLAAAVRLVRRFRRSRAEPAQP